MNELTNELTNELDQLAVSIQQHYDRYKAHFKACAEEAIEALIRLVS